MSDHFSGPAVMGDPSVDITDFYAFPSPERPGNLVLIMNVFPMATLQSCFSNALTHRFRLRPLTRSSGGVAYGTAEYTIDVTSTLPRSPPTYPYLTCVNPTGELVSPCQHF
jgi:hypothetical protein